MATIELKIWKKSKDLTENYNLYFARNSCVCLCVVPKIAKSASSAENQIEMNLFLADCERGIYLINYHVECD